MAVRSVVGGVGAESADGRVWETCDVVDMILVGAGLLGLVGRRAAREARCDGGDMELAARDRDSWER